MTLVGLPANTFCSISLQSILVHPKKNNKTIVSLSELNLTSKVPPPAPYTKNYFVLNTKKNIPIAKALQNAFISRIRR